MNNILFLAGYFCLACLAHADGRDMSMSIGVVSFDNSDIQISTTKDTLRGDDVLICPAAKNSCRFYHGSDFSIAKPNYSVEDVATGKNVYTYTLINSKNYKLQAQTTLAFIFHGNSIKTSDVRFDDQGRFIIKNDKNENIISYCTSSEGVHVLSKPGDVHLYYSLGYEIEANCSDEVYK